MKLKKGGVVITDMPGVCVVKDTCSVCVLNPANTSSSSLNSEEILSAIMNFETLFVFKLTSSDRPAVTEHSSEDTA